MTQVTVGENEGIESALRRFKRQVSKSGIFADLKDLDIMKPPLKNIKESFNKEEKQEEDNCLLLNEVVTTLNYYFYKNNLLF